MVKIDLITGFLGSGKTTFILKYARHLLQSGLKVGILEYDYGAVNVDVMLLSELRGKNCELEMLAAACDADCLKRRFRTKLIAMAMSGYDRVVVEPSGIYDVDDFFDALREEPLDRFYEIGSVLAVVSAKTEEVMSAEENFMLASQAACAGKIVLSRTQEAAPAEIEGTKVHIAAAAQEIKCSVSFDGRYLEKNWDEFSKEDLDSLAEAGYRLPSYVKVTAGQEHSEFASVCFLQLPDQVPQILKKAEELFASSEYGNVLRVKGFAVENGVRFEVNATKNETTVRPIKNGQSVMIVTGTGLDEKKIRSLMEKG